MTQVATGYAIPATPARTDRWTDVFRSDTAIHLLVMAAITFATFQGYLKDRIGGPVPYALADLCFLGAVVIWFGGLALRHAPVRAPGYAGALTLVVIVVPTLYLLHPQTPWIIELAGLRAWAAYPFGCFMALTAIRTRGQVDAYIRLILILCVITAVYGIRQYMIGPDVALGTDLAQLRHGTTVFYDIAGTSRAEFRAFSTFTFPAPFAGMMVFGMLLGIGIATSSEAGRRQRVLAALVVPLLFVGMTVSGTRAALIVLLLGLLVLGVFRGLRVVQLLLIPVLVAALHIGALLTAGSIIERYRTVLLREGVVWTYVSQPVRVAWDAIQQNPWGLGLGRTGVGVPFQIVRSYPSDYFIFSDGDIGRAAAEMGVFGLLLLAVVLFGLVPYAVRAARHLVRTRSQPAALGIGALIVSTGVLLLIGSPLSSAPHGMIWWFLLGAVLKLSMLEHETIAQQT